MIVSPDNLHRVAKMLLDSGEAASVEEAMSLLRTYELAIQAGPEVADSPTLQASLLTAVNCARRCFLGGVHVEGNLDVPLKVPWRSFSVLGDAVVDLGGRRVVGVADRPRIVLGSAPSSGGSEFAVRATFEGWRGGVVPLDDGRRLSEQQEFTCSGVLAGSLAVSEAFQYVRGGNATAGRRTVGLSLWKLEEPWLSDRGSGATVDRLPARFWLIGLGHLGQAYLWTAGLLPYAKPDEVDLVLQDFDHLTLANDSTSLLTHAGILGQKKARAMAAWCDARGFRTRVVERYFSDNFSVDDTEPQLALCGVDNALARSALEGVGFRRVIDAGLGAGPREFLAFQIRTFPSTKAARAVWDQTNRRVSGENVMDKPGYLELARAGLDECGLTILAGRTVGAPFVGAAVSAVVVAEAIRMALGAHSYELIDGSLRSLERRDVLKSQPREAFNPGWASACKS